MAIVCPDISRIFRFKQGISYPKHALPLYNRPVCVYTDIDMTTKRRNPTIILACVAGGLCVLWLILLWVRTLSPAFSDFVCRYVARPWVYVIGHVNSLFPFSVYEWILVWLVCVGVALLIAAVILLCRKQWRPVLAGLSVVAVFAFSVAVLYTVTVGFSYYRPAVPVPQSEQAYTGGQVTEMVQYFLDDYNALAQKLPRDKSGNVRSPYSMHQLSKKLQREYKRLGSSYYYGYTPRGKGVCNSWFMTLNNVSGLTFVPLGECTVNRQTPPSDIPQTMAHEMAHAKGVMREGDANFVAYYVLLTSQDEYLRYCGYFSCFYALLSAVNADTSNKQDYVRMQQELSPLIKTEQQNAYRFWSEKSKQPGFAGWINRVCEKIGDFMNDVFLKSNGADNGNDSYNDVATDGSVTDTGAVDPDTGDTIYAVTYSSVQKMFFAVFEQAKSTQSSAT